MRVVIDIPETDYELLVNDCCGEARKEAILFAVKHGIPVTTNGSAVTAVFPNCDVLTFSESSWYADEVRVRLPMVYGYTTWHSFDKKWWNAPMEEDK